MSMTNGTAPTQPGSTTASAAATTQPANSVLAPPAGPPPPKGEEAREYGKGWLALAGFLLSVVSFSCGSLVNVVNGGWVIYDWTEKKREERFEKVDKTLTELMNATARICAPYSQNEDQRVIQQNEIEAMKASARAAASTIGGDAYARAFELSFSLLLNEREKEFRSCLTEHNGHYAVRALRSQGDHCDAYDQKQQELDQLSAKWSAAVARWRRLRDGCADPSTNERDMQ